MANLITDDMMGYIGVLAQLELSETEREQARTDMRDMLHYIDRLNELDTEGVEPMSHIFPISNVFREDIVTNGDDRKNIIKNAPKSREGNFVVPRTVE